MTRVSGIRWTAAWAAVALGLAVVAIVLLTHERPPAEGPPGNRTVSEVFEAREPERLTATAVDAATSRTRWSPVSKATRVEVKPARLAPEAIAIEITPLDTPVPVRPRHAPMGPVHPPGTLTGKVRFSSGDRPAFEVAIVAGLNTGRSVKITDGVEYRMEEMIPGVNLVELTVEKRKVLRQVKLANRTTTKLDFDLARARPGQGTLTDVLTSLPITGGVVEIDGEQYTSDGRGEFTTHDIAEGDSLFYANAAGLEFRRSEVKWTSFRRGPPRPFEFQLRRSTPLFVTFDGPADSDDTPIAVAVPKQKTGFAVAFEKCCIVKGKKGSREVVLDGLPNDEDFRVYLFLNSAIAVPPYWELGSLDAAATRPRGVRFIVESRKRLRGTVLFDGVPVSEARVKLESAEVAEATERWFGALAFSRFPFPVLSCARKEMETGKDGKFAFEITDLLLPANLSIDKAGLPPLREGVPSGSLNLGAIELKPPLDAPEGETPPGIAFEFPDERERTVDVLLTAVGDSKSRQTDWNLTARRSPAFRVPRGNYRVKVMAGGSSITTEIRVDGEALVPVDFGGPRSR